MRVLQILPYYQPAYRYGGPIKSAHGLNKALVQAGVDVTVFTTNIDGAQDLDVPLGKEVQIDGVKVYYYPVQKPRSYVYSPQFKQALQAHLLSFHLVHIHGLYVYPTAVTAHLCRHYHIPYLIAPRGMLDKYAMQVGSAMKRGRKRSYLRLIEQTNLDNAAALHFTAEEERRHSLYACSEERSVIVPNSLDIAEFKWTNELEGVGEAATDTVLFLSRIDPKKGLDILIPAFAKVVEQYPRARLRLVGPDNDGYFSEVEQLIIHYQMQKHIQYDGMLVGIEKIKAFHQASLFVLPSYSENFGNVVLEALACGTAVVISDRVNIYPEIQYADAGLVVSCDVDELAHAILELLNDPQRATEMSWRGKQLVEACYSLESVAKQMLVVYQAILNNE